MCNCSVVLRVESLPFVQEFNRMDRILKTGFYPMYPVHPVSDLESLFFIRELGAGKYDLDGKVVDIARAEERILVYKQILK